MDSMYCSEFERQFHNTCTIVAITLTVLYSIFLIFNISSIRKLNQQKQISNRGVVKQSYICIMLILISRIIASISLINWNNKNIDNQIDMYLIIFNSFSILIYPLMLVLISITTYQWYLTLIKNEFHQYLTHAGKEQQDHLRDKLKKTKIFFIALNTLFFVSIVVGLITFFYPKSFYRLGYTYILLCFEFIFQSVALGLIGRKLYQESRNKDWTIKYIAIICIMFLGKAIVTLFFGIYMFYFDSTKSRICIPEDTQTDYIRTLETCIFVASNYNQVFFVLFELAQYTLFELLPCIVFHHIIRPKSEMWFYECNDPLSEQLRKETQNLFESVNSQ